MTIFDRFESFSREELIQRVIDIEEELRMGRVFEDSRENINHDAILQWIGRNRFLSEKVSPVRLEPREDWSLNPHLGTHWIIDGDNLATMHSLLTDYRGGPNRGFDIIYFDPPYNTGNDVFSYNDNYRYTRREIKELKLKHGRSEHLVSLDDPNRHTKWINHIAPRLWVAKKLLKDTGIIIVSIDEHELPRLWLLMEEMFDENNRIATLIWERSRKNDANYISEGHEYILIWARNKKELDVKRSTMGLNRDWENVKGRWRKRKQGADAIQTVYMEAISLYGENVEKIQEVLDAFFKSLPKNHPARKIRYRKVDKNGVFNDDGDLNWPGGGGPRYDVIHPVTNKPCKIPASGWRISNPEDMQRLIDDDRIAFKKSHLGIPRLKRYLHEMGLEVQTSVISRSGQRAVEVVDSLLGKNTFRNPKDHELLAGLFNLVTWHDKNALILDPYAGSGTTGHAVLDMNEEDNGNRKFILIEQGSVSQKSSLPREEYTNSITAERIRRVIQGRRDDSKPHSTQEIGFTFFRAHEAITKEAIMGATRESLADIILQVVEDDSNRIDFRFNGYTHLIGRTRLGYGIALIWDTEKDKYHQVLTLQILESVLLEAEQSTVMLPIHIYATGNIAPISNDLYRFHQIPDSLLVRLNILRTEDIDDE